MRKLWIALLAAAAMAGFAPAKAQQFNNIPSGTVIGRTQSGSGPAQAIPFSTLLATLLTSSPTIPTLNTNSIIFKGSNSGQATVQAQAVAGTPSLNLPNTSGTIPSTATSPIVLDPVTGAISCPTCATSVSASQPVVASRAFAQTQNLSALSAVKTLGYAAAGDGGGATFVKLAAGSPFQDSYVLTGTLVGGSGYTNGTYKGVIMAGGSSVGTDACLALVTVSGGAVTSVDISGTYCADYKVGDVLTPTQSQVGGTGTGATFTVATIQAAQGSFTDSVGTLFQIVADQAAYPNVRQYGCKLDWNGNDATATNDILCYRSAIAQASITTMPFSPTIQGNTIDIPKGTSLICDGGTPFATLKVPFGVLLHGASKYAGTTLKQCTAENSSTHVIVLCNPNAASGEFGCGLENLGVNATGSGSVGAFAVYSNSGQQFALLKDVYLQPTTRGCIKYETGVGGAANAIFDGIDCEVNSSTSNVGASINSSNTQVVFRDSVWGCAPSTCAAGIYAITNFTGASGNLIVDTFHIEGHTNAFNIAGTDQVTIRNGTITSGATNAIILQSTNSNNSVLFENIQSSASVATIQNGHSGGSNFTGNIVKQISCGTTCS